MDKQIIFKGEKVTRTKVKNNIIKVLKTATDKDKFDWYQDANNFCQYLSDKYKIPLDKAIGVVSALSPQRRWDINKRDAEYFISTGGNGRRVNAKGVEVNIHMPVFVNKARKVLTSENDETIIRSILNGQKIKSFYMNIKYPNGVDNVTIDRHAIAVALGRNASNEEQAMTDNHYKFFVDAFKWTADSIGMKPLLLQSITWEVWRRSKKSA
jgi:hypothetical protein